MPQLAFTGLVSAFGPLTLQTATPAKLQLTGLVGAVGQLALVPPTVVFALGSGNGLALTMPRPKLALAGQSGAIGGLSLNLPHPSLALAGDSATVGALTLVPPTVRMVVVGDSGPNSGALVLGLKKLSLALAGVTGSIGTLSLLFPSPAPQFAFAAQEPAIGTISLLVPLLQLQINGQSPLAAGASGSVATTLVMHTEREALSQYTNFGFNSYCAFNGVYLAASDAGIFALTGNTDAGAAIAAAARVGITDFGTSHLKRVDRVYVGYRSDGRLILRVITDETDVRDYALARTQNTGLHGAHARLGKGVEARYWQFELRNDAGANFTLDMMEMKALKLRRRVGGRDA